MTLLKQTVTFPRRLPAAAKDSRSRRILPVIGALALGLGCVLSAPAVVAQSSPVLSGKWQLSCTGRRGKARQISLDISQQGAALSGSFDGGHRSGQLSGSVQGNQVSFQLSGARGAASFTGTTDGNTLDVHTDRGISCTATRQ